MQALQTWDGAYTTGSHGAAALELTAFHLARLIYDAKYGHKIAGYLKGSPAVYGFLKEDLPDVAQSTILAALDAAAQDWQRYPTWGDLHTVRVQHLLGNAPVIGKKYRLAEFPIPGGSNTLYKSAHGLANAPHTARYGATSRLVADMGLADTMQLVLFGGQDGYLASSGFADQVTIWRQGRSLDMPLTTAAAAARFPHRLELPPGL